MFKRLTSQHGLSLIEIMVSTAILGIAMVGFAYMFANARGGTDESGSRRMALNRATQKMEELKRAAFVDFDGSYPDTDLTLLNEGIPGETVTHPDAPETISIGDNLTGSRYWTVEGIDSAVDGVGDADFIGNKIDYKEVTVTVSWTGRAGNTRNIRIATLIAP